MSQRTELSSWKKLQQRAANIQNLSMKAMFAADDRRADRLSFEMPHIFLDYSKNLLDEDVLASLIELAEEVDLAAWRQRMFAGEKINITEDRSVLHVALRNRSQTTLEVDGMNITELVEAQLGKIRGFTQRVRSGEWQGYSGKPISDVVSIGVGGSHLGPQMVTDALVHYADETLGVHYVSNVDGAQIASVLKHLNPETTLFVISSKTFTTVETMTNAASALDWFQQSCSERAAIGKHFVAVSTNKKAAVAFGIEEDNIFDMWDWVGGRFSLWSSIGLPIALYLGYEQFVELLEGAHEMDRHFCDAPLEQNGPVILALLSLWNTTFLGAKSQAILPYDQTLHMLPAYLQQAEMESNGKSTSMDSDPIGYTTVPGIWGGTGINGQHAFYQYLHQSNTVVPADFIGSLKSNAPLGEHHRTLMANFFAQTQALMQGVTEGQVRQDLKAKGRTEEDIDKIAPHKVHAGNRSTNTLLLQTISPQSLGALVALYEHKIFCQGVLLDICSFDQWGVELGKTLATHIEQQLKSGDISPDQDSSTRNLLERFKNQSN